MGTKLLIERFALTGGTVDRSGKYPVIRGVLLCGTTSANRRRYKVESFGAAGKKKYEGKPIFIDHGDGRKSRSFRDKLAWVENESRDSSGRPVGDVGVNPKHDQAEPFLWLAENRPDQCGMSHVAHCKTVTSADGWEEVTEIVDVESVDVVVDPATTKGLYEHRRRTVALTVKALCEALVKHPKIKSSAVAPLKKLAEMDGMDGLDSGMDAAPADDAEPGDGVKDAFCSAIQSVVDKALDGEMEAKEALRQIKELIASHERVKGGKAAPAEEEEPAEEESTKRCKLAADPYAILAEGEKAGYRPTAVEAKALATMTAEERAVWFTEQAAKGKPGQNPSAATRRPGAGSAGNTPANQTTKTIESKARLIPAWDE